ncbi:hypothetical protein GCM10022245_48190 [Streptomyces mayteni]
MDSDPTPGSPDDVRELADGLQTFADDVGEALGRVRRMADDRAVMDWAGLSAEAFRSEFDGVPGNLEKLQTSYDLAAQALGTYWPKLETAQGMADRALDRAIAAQADLSSAQGALSEAQDWVSRAGDEAERLEREGERDDVEPPSEAEVRAATRDATAAGEAASSAQGQVNSAEEALSAARELARQAQEMREEAARACSDDLDEASDAGIQNRSWWENLIRWLSDAWDTLVAICKIVVAVLGVIAMIIGGPLALIVLAAAVVVLADTLIKYANGEGTLLDVAFAALDCIPGMRGLTTLGGLARMARGGAAAVRNGVGRISTTIRGFRGALRRESVPMLVRVCRNDPIDIATGAMVMSQSDVVLAGALPLVLERSHVSSYRAGRWFGPSWTSTLDQRLEIHDHGVLYASPDGMLLRYPVPRADGDVYPFEGPRWPLSWDGTPGGDFRVTIPEERRTLRFGLSPEARPRDAADVVPLLRVEDRNGDSYDVRYRDGVPTEVSHSGGYRVAVATAGGRITALHLLTGDDETPVTLVRYGYDEHGHLTEVVNSSGLPLRFGYDDEGRITGWRDRNDSHYGYAYDERGRCVRTEGADGFLSGAFGYDDEQRVTTYTDSLGATTTFQLNENLQLVRETDHLGAVTHQEWDAGDRLLARTDPLGRTTTYDYDAAGNLVGVLRPDGVRTTADYAEAGQPSVLVAPDGGEWRYEYDDRGNLVSTTDPGGGVTVHAYNSRGHLVSITDPHGATRTFDPAASGLPTATTNARGATTRYERDAFGRVTAISEPDGGVIRFAWTVENGLAARTMQDGATETWAHDPEGNALSHTAADGAVTRFEYTHFDLPSARVDPDGTRLEFGYDTELRLTSVGNSAGETWQYAYDAVGRLVRETDFGGAATDYAYDVAGQLVERVNAVGQTVRYERDIGGRVVGLDKDGARTSFVLDGAGRILRAANPDAEIAFEFDAAGRITAESCEGRVVASGYDGAGRRTTRRTPSGNLVAWQWTAESDSTPASVTTAGHTIDSRYDPLGREVERRLGSPAVLTQRWDDNHQLAAQALLAADPDQLRERSYGYHPSGRLSVIDEPGVGPLHLGYNASGRVTEARAADWVEQYAYDSAGNIRHASWPPASEHDEAAQGEHAYAGSLPRRAGRTAYEYDAQGRLVRRTQRLLSGGSRTWLFSWDAEDRLTEVTTPDKARWRYLYDPLGRRVAKLRLDQEGAVTERTDFAWDGTHLAEESRQTTGSDEIHSTTWVWQPGLPRPVAQTERTTLRDAPQDEIDERFYAIVTDLVGSPTELVDAEGRVAWRRRSTLWGKDRPGTDRPTRCPLRFPGQYLDAESGLHYNFFRYYDPDTARYCSPDPLGLLPGPNPHGYVHDPLTWMDPLGLSGCNELFYRAMSKKEFQRLGPNGEINVRGENFVTRNLEYVEQLRNRFLRQSGRKGEAYSHLVQYEMQPGTFDALVQAGRGSGDNVRQIRTQFPDLPLEFADEIGSSTNFVHVKLELGGLNFGLREGSVDVFNSNIISHTVMDVAGRK